MTQAKIETVIFDWAGTIVDYGSLAPVLAFQKLFSEQGVPISLAEARGPMGVEKCEHIRQLLAMPRIGAAWQTHFGKMPDEADIERLFQDFLPIQFDTIEKTATPIPGLRDTLAWLQARNIKIASNTGYARDMLDHLRSAPAIQALDFEPDSIVCAPEVTRGRPAPDMSLKNLMETQASSVRHCVKVDDTVVGIEEGKNAGMWTVGVALSGNACGESLASWQEKNATQQADQKAQAYRAFDNSGADFVIDSIIDLPAIIDAINTRMQEHEVITE
ncbi:MAG: phosphonoacetaldehyde hydrolase [Gammaproteobacteria bacterium]|nr:phosphonoacetaldehyde hydrolase [Gammaproteobacteria bacterium]